MNLNNKIVKRDGRLDDFDGTKIEKAILKAFIAIDGDISDYAIQKAKNIAEFIETQNQNTALTVEQIQDLVEKGLMNTRRKDVARAFITYRNERTLERERNSDLIKTIWKKIMASDVQNQNANVDEHSFGGRMGESNSAMMRKLALDYCMSIMARNNHLNNEIYTHDLDHFVVGDHNCLTIPYDHLLKNGFNTRQTDIRPAKSVATEFQLIAVLAQIQSLCQFGGVAASHLDWTSVPYVRMSFTKHFYDGLKYIEKLSEYKLERFLKYIEKDLHKDSTIHFSDEEIKKFHEDAWQYAMDLTIKETNQAVEGMYHNLNSLQSRSGNQLPFSSINYGTCTLPEGRLVIKALLEGSLKGIGKLHKTSIFPCGIFQLAKGINRAPGDPNYDLFQLALKSTSLRLYPNYANIDWSGNAGYDKNDPSTYFATMGCRTANGFDINGLGQQKDGRGNICPVTIIMPTIAMQAKEEYENQIYELDADFNDDEVKSLEEIFLEKLDTKIHEAKDQLIERFEWICSQDPKSAAFMYENNVMAGYIPEEGIRSALKHGTLAIGNLGLAETLQIIIGCDHTTDRGMQYAKKIYSLFSNRCNEFKEKYKLNFGVYNTPAENLSHTAMKKFKEKYGVIENVSDKEFFTNSMHVPVWKKMTPFEKIDIESQLTGYSSAGCICYVELDSSCKNNLEGLEAIVNYAMDKDIPYFAVNVPNDTCLECGFTDELGEVCPKCGSKHIQRLRRVTGYLTGDYKSAFNKGKQQEVEMRVKHG